MDLMRILRSLEEFLYELVGWLVFYPRTLWRIMRNPPSAARYALRELAKPPENQFSGSISPVLMLILSVVLAHAIELVSGQEMPKIANPVGQRLLGTEQGLLITRSVVFSGYALLAALVTLRRQHQLVTRDTLRAPFAVQAFLISPLVVMLAIATMLVRLDAPSDQVAGVFLFVLALVWYVWARISTYHALTDAGWLLSAAIVSVTFLGTTAAVVLLWTLMLS